MTKAEHEWSLIEALVYCKGKRLAKKSCAGCPYAGVGCGIDAAIEKLKAQEPATVIPTIKKNDELLTEGICPICGAKLDYYLNGQFCGCCGKRLKWE